MRPGALQGPLPDPIPAEVFAGRRERLAPRLGGDVLVLPGARVQHSSRDSEHPFRPDSELFWATGLMEPDVVAVLRGGERGGRPHFVLFARARDAEAELWSGVRPDPAELRASCGADEVHALDTLPTRLPELLDGADRVFFRLGAHAHIEPFVLGALARARSKGARRGTGPRGVMDPGEVLDDLRLVKDAHEIGRLREAAALTVASFAAMAPLVAAGRGEWELQAALEAGFRAGGGEGPAFGTIVASGPNACVLHYTDHRRRLEPGELVLIDAGASRGLYAGDITRTFPVSGVFTGAGASVHGAVEAARAAAVAAVRPGATVAAVHDAAVRVLCEWLVDEGLVGSDGAGEDAAAVAGRDGHKPFFPHSTSHWLGLDVHDPGDYARGGASRVLEPGMVLTVEPGLYFGPSALAAAGDAAGRFAGIGVRVEDDVLVTPDGHENLTAGLPTDPAALEALIRR